MKSSFKFIGAICLSALLLFSTLSFAVGMHFCGGHMVDMALNEKAHGCGMERPAENSEPTINKVAWHCCADVLLTYEGQQDLQQTITAELNSAFQALLPDVLEFTPEIQVVGAESYAIPWYTPPPIIRDLPVQYQSFLI